MLSIRDRVAELDLPRSPTPLSDFLDEFGTDPIRDFVEYRLNEAPGQAPQDSAMDDWAQAADGLNIPVDLEIFARVAGTLKARYIVNQTYWRGPTERTCAQSLLDTVQAVHHEHPTLTSDLTTLRGLPESDQRNYLCLFFMTSDLFAALASESRMLRKHIGIRKGMEAKIMRLFRKFFSD